MPRFTARPALLPLAFSLVLPALAHAAPPDSPVPSAQNPTMTLAVDATEAARHILHVQMDIPAQAGALTLVYPKWLPGEHAPNGPIANLSGVVFTAGGQTLVWNRDLVDMYAFHLKVPGGARSVHAAFDLLTASDPAQATTTDNLADIAWTSLVLYPQGRTADTVNVAASLRLPTGWKYATALPLSSQNGDMATFQPAPLSTFLDSPLIAGAYAKVVPLTTPGDPAPVEIDMVADSPDSLDMPDSQIQAYKNLVVQAQALWGARHYRDYHFLYTLSDLVHGEGLEHHESSQDTVEADLFSDEPKRGSGDLLAHEYTHSWNGKYRRPYDLFTTDYQMPMRDDLLWVYEGMTEYYGLALTARSGPVDTRRLPRRSGRHCRLPRPRIRPRLASPVRYRCFLAEPKGQSGMASHPPRAGLLHRDGLDLAGSRHHYPQSNRGPQIPGRLRPSVGRRTVRPAPGCHLHPGRHRPDSQRRHPLRLAQVPARPHLHHRAARAFGRHHQ